MIVGFHSGMPGTCPDPVSKNGEYVPQTVNPTAAGGDRILWTYGVSWERTDIPTADRWDRYWQNTDWGVDWVGLLSSVMILGFLSGLVIMIALRTLSDLHRYNQKNISEDDIDETGWKLVHGDVFRSPSHPLLLSVLVGSGVQVLATATLIILFALFGLLSPAHRGALITTGIVLYNIMGLFAGMVSSRLYRRFKGLLWKRNALVTSLAFPGLIFILFFIINMTLRGQHSSSAVPATTFIKLITLWLGLNVPLVFCGTYLSLRMPLPDDPVPTNQIPRQIPETVWYRRSWFSILAGGVLPFGVIFLQWFFILLCLWNDRFYNTFGFLFVSFIIFVVTCAEITIFMGYFQLCGEDYHWWWRSFFTASTSSLYVFLYSTFYFFVRLDISSPVSAFVYFGYTLIIALFVFVLTGSVGFYACYFFIWRIFASVKVA
eukprot:TRINITY_DN3038_c0_g1_i6.p1 TRINITY_DN3038_c0_g1~~TRINITY_DN3038_c0_g1_i6.p1  ORF type:complete len:432 (-),score=68.04 TRINITY_DN3038_c0_g1_i6:37-1332(-)